MKTSILRTPRKVTVITGAIFLAALLVIAWMLPGGLAWNYMIVFAGMAGIFIGLVPLYLYRRQVVGFFDRTNVVMGKVTQGDSPDEAFISIPSEDETVESRFWANLRRLCETCQSTRQLALRERERLQTLVSDISHQVKTPLSNITIGLSMLGRDDAPPGQKQEFLQSTQTAVSKLTFLLESLVKMSRLETGLIQLKAQKSNLYDMLANTLGAVVVAAEQKEIHVEVDVPSDFVAQVDGKWTEEALLNIIDNAIKYTPAGGSVTVRGEKLECYSKISIQNTGRGIPEALHGKVFSRFYRGPGTEREQGIGLGLSLAREIITRQQGFIRLESREGASTAFHIFLPL